MQVDVARSRGGPERDAGPTRSELVALAGVVLVAGVLRWVSWERTVIYFADGPEFLEIARRFDAGDWMGGFAHDYHPLYSFLTFVVHRVGTSMETAAAAVSVLAGTAAVALLYGLLRPGFGARTALVGAALLAVHDRAINWASDVQSDALYLALFLASLLLGQRALLSRSARLAGGSGVAAGLAYLTRPEGLVATVAVGILAGVYVLRERWRPLPTLGWVGALAAGVVLCVLPYATVLRAQSGSWMLSKKKSVVKMVRMAPEATPRPAAPAPGETAPPTGAAPRPKAAPPPPASPRPKAAPPPAAAPRPKAAPPPAAAPRPKAAPPPAAVPRPAAGRPPATGAVGPASAVPPSPPWSALRRAIGASLRIAHEAITSLRYEMFAALLVGLALSVGRPGERALLALVVTGVYTLLLYALVFEYGYVSRRHVFPMLVVGFGWVALGVEAVGRGGLVLARRWGVRAGPAAAATLGLALVGVIPLTRQLEPKRIDKLAERRAADWLHANAPGPGAVAADRRRVAEYAHARFVSLRTLRSPDRIAELRKRGARYVVADDPAILDRLGLLRSEGVRLIHHEVGDGQEAWVFELPPP